MREWEDYYKIIQVHHLADTEVIESAYRKLSKRYHPDLNNNPEAFEEMLRINRAYNVLRNPAARKDYYLRWVEKNCLKKQNLAWKREQRGENLILDPSGGIIDKYFNYLYRLEYEAAYELISEKDKEKITLKDFLAWQRRVAEIFALKKFACSISNVYRSRDPELRDFELIAEFKVEVVEENQLLDRIEEDSLSKLVVFEKGEWRVYLGYQNISRLISRFEDLAKLKHIKLLGRSEGIVQGKIDRISGLLSFSAFMEIAEQEQQRHNRYGNTFSLLLCELPRKDRKEKRAPEMRIIGDLIRDNIRKIDFACRWKAGKFLILLPETDEKAAKRVSKKLKSSRPDLRINIREQDEDSITNLLVKLA